MVKFVPASSGEDLAQVRALLVEYASAPAFCPCFRSFERELAELPGEYAPPAGRLLLAVEEGRAAGCVALRRLTPEVCEIKRLYVRPEFRRKGIGRGLVKALLAEARRIGYERVRLETLPAMQEAIALYRSLGFQESEPYGLEPVKEALYMELPLKSSAN